MGRGMKNSMREVLKRLYKQKIKLLALFISVIFFVGAASKITVEGKAATKASNDNGTVNDGNLDLTKTAEVSGNDSYRIKFKVAGDIGQQIIPKVNIIFMIDTSGSMADVVGHDDNSNRINHEVWKIDKVREAVNNFCDSMDAQKDKDVLLSIGEFNGHSVGKSSDAKINVKYTSNFQAIKNDVFNKALMQTNDAATNLEEGINKIAGMIKNPQYESISDRNRKVKKTYVILFTDGVPTLRTGERYNDTPAGVTHFIASAENAHKQLVRDNEKNNRDVDFYSVGLFNDNDKAFGEALLKNISSPDKFLEATDAQGIVTRFKEISDTIEGEKIDCIANDARITDTIAEDFQMPSKEELESSLKSQLKDEIDSGVLKAESIKVDVDGRDVTFHFGEIKSTELEFYFDIKPRNDYFSGTNIPTNDGAYIQYVDPIDKEVHKSYFEDPEVKIEPKEGNITVEKLIVDNEGNEISSNLDNTSFNVSLRGNKETYNFDLLPNKSALMSYYMRDDETNLDRIESFTDYDIYKSMLNKNYITVGEYKVSEICPMNYKLVSIEVSYNGGAYNNINPKDIITIDKNSPNISIRIKNTKVNDKYWWDNNKTENRFKYTSQSAPET